jgi:hypothetical protein
MDKRYSIKSFDGQKKALDSLFNQFLVGAVDHEKIKGCVALIREARQVLQAERTMAMGNDAVSTVGPLTPNGPFPRLIKK